MASLEERVARVEAHTEALIRTVDGIQADIADIRAELRGMRADMSQKFIWLIGTQVATLVAMVGAMAATLAAVIYR